MEKLIYQRVFSTSYRELNTGDVITVRKKTDKYTVITINKGRKEYRLPNELIDVIRFIGNITLTNELIFKNKLGYDRVIWEGSKMIKLSNENILSQLTETGKELYLLGEYGIEVIDWLNSSL